MKLKEQISAIKNSNNQQNTSSSSVRSSNTFNKNNRHSNVSAKCGKELATLADTDLQYKTHYRRVLHFARSQKSQHKYIVSKCLGWKLFLSGKLISGWRWGGEGTGGIY